jgi:carbonic anhydrase/acetyltransferase-like protein (isoleucine patch superfamily)
VSAVIKGAIVGAGSSMSEVNLVPNKILILGSAASQALSQKLSISSLQTAFAEIVKHSQETIYDDDTPEEQARKLNSRNWNERVLHHLF